MSPLGAMFRQREVTERLSRPCYTFDWMAWVVLATGLALLIATVLVLAARL